MQTCKGPHGHRKSAANTKGQTDKESIVARQSPSKPAILASSRGRPLKPKPPFTIEARPSRLRRKGGPSSVNNTPKGRNTSARQNAKSNNKAGAGNKVTGVVKPAMSTQTEMTFSNPESMLEADDNGRSPIIKLKLKQQ